MGMGAKLASSLSGVFKGVFGGMIGWMKKPVVDHMKEEVAKASIDPEIFTDKKVKTEVETLKEKWSKSPGSMSDIANDVMGVVTGRVAELQLEEITGVEIDDSIPTTNNLVGQMAGVTNLCLVSNLMGIIGEIIPTTQLGQIGAEMRSYLDYSGFSQVTGFGYGMILNQAIGPKISQELKSKMQDDILDQGTLRVLLMRGYISEEWYLNQMAKHGFTEGKADGYFLAGQYYPPAPDFIRFGVREVFREEIVEQYGYDEDYPIDIEEPAAKAGMDSETLKWYWRAHWDIPSPQMGFEMLHRKKINQQELRTLLKIADFAPGWIDKMIAISYSPYTRVDARRMYELGVLNDDEYVAALEEIGYAPEKAEKLLEWTQLRTADPDRDLTKSQIIQAFRLGLIDEADAVKYLQGLFYDKTEAELLVRLENRKEELKVVEEQVKLARLKYVEGFSTVDTFTQELSTLGIIGPKAQLELARAERERVSKRLRKLPSKEDVLGWLEKKKIDHGTARKFLTRIGYDEQYVDLYLGVEA